MTIKISVITIAYNSEKTIEKTIKSVLNQSFKDFEYIIVDGGSTDSTVDIIKSYESKFNGRLKWVSESDNGIYDAFNKGINLSTGDYIGFINSDDWYQHNALEMLEVSLSESKPDVIFGLLNVWEGNNLVWVYCNFCSTIHKESLAHPSTFISRDTYEQHGLYSLDYKSASDYEMFIRLYQAGCRFKYVDTTFANFARGGVSGTSVGYFETLKIKLRFKYISCGHYYFLYFRKKIIDFLRGSISHSTDQIN